MDMNIEERAKRLRLQAYQRDTSRVARGRDHWQFTVGKQEACRIDFIATALEKQRKRHLAPRAFAEPVGHPVQAMVNHNRWIAFCECGGCEAVDPADPVFYCLSCHNAENGGLPRPVRFPRAWQSIEAVLLARDDPLNRGWVPTETVRDLEAENAAHGLPRRASRPRKLGR